MGTKGDARYIAPENVYRTAKTLKVNSSVSELSWGFPVSKSVTHHLVRAHFCDIVSAASTFFEFNHFCGGSILL